MKLLIEEFFGEIFGFIDSINFFLMKILIKFVFYLLISLIFIFLILLFYTKKGYLVLVILGLYIVAEIFHYIRKSREKSMDKL